MVVLRVISCLALHVSFHWAIWVKVSVHGVCHAVLYCFHPAYPKLAQVA
eukprot:jgi/Mesvir1/8629/Mv26101-RA.1